MREILFRGKRKDNGEWVEGCLYYFHLESNPKNKTRCFIILPDELIDNENEFEVIPETVGQWTRMTDKNGVNIFEGDILARKNYWKLVVEFQKIMPFDEVQYNNSKGISINGFSTEYWEVIGNIHDEPKGGAE